MILTLYRYGSNQHILRIWNGHYFHSHQNIYINSGHVIYLKKNNNVQQNIIKYLDRHDYKKNHRYDKALIDVYYIPLEILFSDIL